MEFPSNHPVTILSELALPIRSLQCCVGELECGAIDGDMVCCGIQAQADISWQLADRGVWSWTHSGKWWRGLLAVWQTVVLVARLAAGCVDSWRLSVPRCGGELVKNYLEERILLQITFFFGGGEGWWGINAANWGLASEGKCSTTHCPLPPPPPQTIVWKDNLPLLVLYCNVFKWEIKSI